MLFLYIILYIFLLMRHNINLVYHLIHNKKNRLAYGIPIWISLVIKKEFKDADKARVPVDLVPAEMKEISSEIICKGLMYKITFIKP